MVKPRQVYGWLFQLIGVVLLYFTFFGNFYNIKINIIYGVLTAVSIGYGRTVYVPDVKLLHPCPKCGREIKLTNKECPYCHIELNVSSRFNGISGNDT